MPTPPPENTTSTPILFRPSKKRKLYRHREASPPATSDTPPAAQSIDELIASSAGDGDSRREEVSQAEILRLRRQRRTRIGERGETQEAGRDEDMEMQMEMEIEEASTVGRRFAPQTGVVGMGDVDRHMMAFIDSELAKRGQEGKSARAETGPTSTSTTTSTSARQPAEGHGEKERAKEPDMQRQPATLGRLLEIDLGDEARDRNVEMTNQARRRMDGEVIEEDQAPKGKVKLGRDGKPWRPRKRRGSEDIKRDKMVEDILRENRLDIYDELPAEPATVNDDQAADDIIAEAFRKEFMDAVSQRQRKKAVPAQPPARGPGGKREEELKGPKLGGSRSARAAMRETLLKSQAKK